MVNFYRYYPYQYNRSDKNILKEKNNLPPPSLPQQQSLPPVYLPTPPKPCSPKNKKIPPKKKLDFKSLKKDTCTSLNDVECFLNNFSHTLKYIKLINLLK